MRAALVTLLLTLPLLAGERAVAGAERLLGDATLAPIAVPYRYGNDTVMATDGDEVLMVWTDRGSLYGQRLDRFGKRATALPTLLYRGSRNVPVSGLRVVYAGGLYTIFFHTLDEKRTWVTSAIRLTPKLDVVMDRRVVLQAAILDGVHTGEEFVLVTDKNVWRMRDDFSVIALLPKFDGSVLVPSPRGVLLIAASEPAMTARMIDDSISVRVASADNVQAMRAMWTGTEYLLVWTDGRTKALVLDENLVARAAPVTLDDKGCTWCSVGIAKIGNDDVIVTWQVGDNTRMRRLRNGLPADSASIYLGDFIKAFSSAHGLLFTVDRMLNVRAFIPGSTGSPSALPVLAMPVAAAEESVVAVGTSASEVAIVRQRNDRTNVVSIVDPDGRTLREVAIPAGDFVNLSHDGKDFYALVSNYYESRFQRVEAGAAATKLAFRADRALVWTGSGFFILQSDYRDFTGATQYRSRFLGLTREGVVELPPCEHWEFPSSASWPPAVVRTGDETAVAVGFHIARLRGACQTGPPVKTQSIPYNWRPGWQDGLWAWLVTGNSRLELATTDDPATTPSLHRIAGNVFITENSYDLTPFAGRWLVAYNEYNQSTLRASVHDANGALIGTSTIADSIDGRPFLVPIADRVLAVYRRQVWESPYLGVHRVFVTPVTLETASRRRTARP